MTPLRRGKLKKVVVASGCLSCLFFATEIGFRNPVDLQVVGNFGFAVDLRRLDLAGGGFIFFENSFGESLDCP